jgi:hypothetical protein
MDHWTRFRWRLRLLAVVDWLLGTHFVEGVTGRWRRELQDLQQEIASLQERLEDLDASRGAMLRQVCLGYLQVRSLRSPAAWLHFDPREPDEEAAIDVLTRALVRTHYARWRMAPVDHGGDPQYTYDLVPDWEALYQDALQHAGNLPAGLLAWLADRQEE